MEYKLNNLNQIPSKRSESGQLLLHISDDILDSMNEALKPFGITESRFGLLILIQRNAESNTTMKPSEIAVKLGIKRASVTKQLNWLENRHFISRSNDKKDQRATSVKITDRGLSLIRKAMPAYWDTCSRFTENLSEKETAVLSALLKKIHR